MQLNDIDIKELSKISSIWYPTEGTQRFTVLICIEMFILKLQARDPEKLWQAHIQSPTRIKMLINQISVRFSHRFVYRE